MTRVLIAGADGTIGQALERALLKRGDQVIGTSRRADSSRIRLDFASEEDFRFPPADVTVICAAMARFADCRDQPELARRVNVDAPAAIAKQQAERGGKTILLSTSAVFDGTRPHMPAGAPTNPASAYGRFKAEAERAVLEYAPYASVLRLTKVIGPDLPLLRDWVDRLKRGEAIEAFRDLWISPLDLGHVIAALIAVIDDSGNGIYQVSGRDDVSYAELARLLASNLGADARLVRETSAADRISAEERPRHTSLDTGRLGTLIGFVPPLLAEVAGSS